MMVVTMVMKGAGEEEVEEEGAGQGVKMDRLMIHTECPKRKKKQDSNFYHNNVFRRLYMYLL